MKRLTVVVLLLAVVGGCCCEDTPPPEHRIAADPEPWASPAFSHGLEDSVERANASQSRYRFQAEELRDPRRDTDGVRGWLVKVRDGQEILSTWWAHDGEPFLLLDEDRLLRLEYGPGDLPSGIGPEVVFLSLATGRELRRLELRGPPPDRGIISPHSNQYRLRWSVDRGQIELRSGPSLAWRWRIDATNGALRSGPTWTAWEWPPGPPQGAP